MVADLRPADLPLPASKRDAKPVLGTVSRNCAFGRKRGPNQHALLQGVGHTEIQTASSARLRARSSVTVRSFASRARKRRAPNAIGSTCKDATCKCIIRSSRLTSRPCCRKPRQSARRSRPRPSRRSPLRPASPRTPARAAPRPSIARGKVRIEPCSWPSVSQSLYHRPSKNLRGDTDRLRQRKGWATITPSERDIRESR